MVPLKLFHVNKLPSSVILPSIYVERKNQCADVQLRNTAKILSDQRQKYIKSLSKRKIALILEMKEMKRVKTESLQGMDSSEGNAEESQMGPSKITLTKYSKIRPKVRQRKLGNLKQNITAEEFLRLGFKKVNSDNDDDDEDDNNRNKHTINEPEVLEFEDIKPELPIEKTEQKQLINMVRRFRLSSLGNRTIQHICKVQERKDISRANAKRQRRKSQRETDINSDGCSSDSEDSIFEDDYVTDIHKSRLLLRANTAGNLLSKRKHKETRPFSYREKTTILNF